MPAAAMTPVSDRLDLPYQPAPGLLMHDWGDNAAVVFVPGNSSTHLIDGDAAAIVAAWMASAADPSGAADTATRLFDAAPDPRAARAHFRAQVPLLLQAGILVARRDDENMLADVP